MREGEGVREGEEVREGGIEKERGGEREVEREREGERERKRGGDDGEGERGRGEEGGREGKEKGRRRRKRKNLTYPADKNFDCTSFPTPTAASLLEVVVVVVLATPLVPPSPAFPKLLLLNSGEEVDGRERGDLGEVGATLESALSDSDCDLALVRCRLLHSSITLAFLARIGEGFATSCLGALRLMRAESEPAMNCLMSRPLLTSCSQCSSPLGREGGGRGGREGGREGGEGGRGARREGGRERGGEGGREGGKEGGRGGRREGGGMGRELEVKKYLIHY